MINGQYFSEGQVVFNDSHKALTYDTTMLTSGVGFHKKYLLANKLSAELSYGYKTGVMFGLDRHYLRSDLKKNPSILMLATGAGANLNAKLKYNIAENLDVFGKLSASGEAYVGSAIFRYRDNSLGSSLFLTTKTDMSARIGLKYTF